jgi:acetylornithine deacetylase/succinyl-diaminopimelate desuccinylase-like protein
VSAQRTYADEVALARALVQTFSPSGQEAGAAALLRGAFEALGYDEARIDTAGNVIGTLRRGDGPALMLNGHLDTVPTGEEQLWPHPPLAGVIADERLWGRGACDMKGALACMAFAARDAVDAGFRGTLHVSGVVLEETGSHGARALAADFAASPVDAVILGEPSKLHLMLGHRGRVELRARIPGRIAHAARPELGDNALLRAAELLRRLETLQLPTGAALGGSSVTPTQLSTFPPDGANVVPGRADLTLDYRNIPGDAPEQVLARLAQLCPEAELEISGRIIRPYLAPVDHPLVLKARALLAPLLVAETGEALQEGTWWFGTDAPELAAMAGVVLGFGPGEEELAHTTQESVPLAHLALARKAYAALALGL